MLVDIWTNIWYNKIEIKKGMMLKMIGIIFEKPSAMRDGIKAFGGQTGSYKGQQFKIVSSVRTFMDSTRHGTSSCTTFKDTVHAKWDLAYLPWDYKISSGNVM